MEKPKFKAGDRVRIGHPSYGYDIVQILTVEDSYHADDRYRYMVKFLTQDGYSRRLGYSELGYYEYPMDDWEMVYAENALQRLKKRYGKAK
jgi:hypothetical protein